jgi:acyl-CoA-binding protein
MLETSVKPLFLICSSVEDAKDWKRQIREAVAAFYHQEDVEEEEKEEARKQTTAPTQVSTKSVVPMITEIETPASATSTAQLISTKSSSPSAKEGVVSANQKRDHSLLQGESSVQKLSIQYDSLPELKNAFMRAVAVCRPLLSSDSLPPASLSSETGDKSPTALSDADKLLFYGLFKQSVSGDCPSPKNDDDVSMTTSTNIAGEGTNLQDSATESALRAKRDAWLTFKGMRRRDAMRKFVCELDVRLPNWNAAE